MCNESVMLEVLIKGTLLYIKGTVKRILNMKRQGFRCSGMWCYVIQCVFFCFCSKTNQMHQCIKLFYFGITLCVFRTVFPSIIRSLRLYIEQLYVQILLSACQQVPASKQTKTNQMHQHIKLFYFEMTLHVLDGLSIHHQEFKTVHRATVCTDTAVCLLAGTCQQAD